MLFPGPLVTSEVSIAWWSRTRRILAMENLQDDPDNSNSGVNVSRAEAIQLLLQNGQTLVGDGDLEDHSAVIGGHPSAAALLGGGDDVGHSLPVEMSAEEAVQNITDMDMSGVDIVTLQPAQMQSMFQIVTTGSVSAGGGGSYVLSDGQLLQAHSPGGGEGVHGFQSVTLPSGMAALIQGDTHKGGDGLDGQHTVQLEDGSTAVVHNVGLHKEPAPPLPSKLLEGQMIQLEDGTTGLIQAGLDGTDSVQSVTLEDGSTAYISLFGEPPPGALSIDHGNHMAQAMEVENGAHQNGAGTVVKIEPDSIGTHQRANVGIISQPHLSERALALGDKAYKCTFEHCGRLYTTQHHLKVHERSHTGDKPFRCEFTGCGKAFPTGYGLKSHTRVHTGEKPYRCAAPECHKAFKTSGDLQKHVRTHTGERPFHCPFEGCDRSFTTSNIRKVHIRTHTGERPYVCREDGCGKSFASATNYKNHIRIHTGEKPYMCTVEGCGKRFTEYSSLYKHHVVHTQSKPYVCNHCNKTYRQTSTLAMHKRTVHNDHDMTLDTEATLLGTVSGVQIISPLQRDGDRDPELVDGDGGALIINTSESGQLMTAVTKPATVTPMLTTLQTVPQGSPTLLQHLNQGSVPVQQVYLIAHPKHTESKDDGKTSVDQITVDTDILTTTPADQLISHGNNNNDGVTVIHTDNKHLS